MERATDETRWTRESQRDGHERSPQVGPIRQHEGVEQMKQMKKTRSIFAAICVALSAFASPAIKVPRLMIELVSFPRANAPPESMLSSMGS